MVSLLFTVAAALACLYFQPNEEHMRSERGGPPTPGGGAAGSPPLPYPAVPVAFMLTRKRYVQKLLVDFDVRTPACLTARSASSGRLPRLRSPSPHFGPVEIRRLIGVIYPGVMLPCSQANPDHHQVTPTFEPPLQNRQTCTKTHTTTPNSEPLPRSHASLLKL